MDYFNKNYFNILKEKLNKRVFKVEKLSNDVIIIHFLNYNSFYHIKKITSNNSCEYVLNFTTHNYFINMNLCKNYLLNYIYSIGDMIDHLYEVHSELNYIYHCKNNNLKII